MVIISRIYCTAQMLAGMISWNGNTAMLVLIGNAEDGSITPALWGVQGNMSGMPIWFDQLDQSATYNIVSAVQSVDGGLIDDVLDLPIAQNYVSSYYTARYVDISEAWWASWGIGDVGNLGAKATAKIATKLGAGPIVTNAAAQSVKWILRTLPAITGEGTDIVEDLGVDLGYYWDKTLGSAWTTYPVMTYSPYGAPGWWTLHFSGPSK